MVENGQGSDRGHHSMETLMREVKPGIGIDIPGFGELHIKAVCSDYTGTLSCEGKLIAGVKKRLHELGRMVDIHVVTSDTRKTAHAELASLRRERWVILKDEIEPDDHDVFKRDYIQGLGIDMKHVAIFGNGRNDRLWLNEVKDKGGLAIAVDVGEGCAVEAMMNANVFVTGITNALDLLLDQKRVIGTLRTKGDKHA
jgi:soluble P-type ATPase